MNANIDDVEAGHRIDTGRHHDFYRMKSLTGFEDHIRHALMIVMTVEERKLPKCEYLIYCNDNIDSMYLV